MSLVWTQDPTSESARESDYSSLQTFRLSVWTLNIEAKFAQQDVYYAFAKSEAHSLENVLAKKIKIECAWSSRWKSQNDSFFPTL